MTVCGGVGVLVRVGVSEGTLRVVFQKPPCTIKLPPECDPASGWPIVPPTVYTPPVLNVPPPPSTVDHERSKVPPTWAYTMVAVPSRIANKPTILSLLRSRNGNRIAFMIWFPPTSSCYSRYPVQGLAVVGLKS